MKSSCYVTCVNFTNITEPGYILYEVNLTGNLTVTIIENKTTNPAFIIKPYIPSWKHHLRIFNNVTNNLLLRYNPYDAIGSEYAN